MLHSRLHRPLLALFGLTLLLAVGCGVGKGTPTSGKLVLPQGVQLAETDSVEVTFFPDDPKVKRGATATVKTSDLSFTANTSETTGVLPGKYKIAVRITPYMGSPGTDKRVKALEPLNQKFEREKTPLTFDVPAGNDTVNLTIDLAKGTVTKS